MNEKARRIFEDTVTKAIGERTNKWWMDGDLSALPTKVRKVIQKIKNMKANPGFKDEFMLVIGLVLDTDLSSYITKDSYGVALIPISNPNGHNYPEGHVLILTNEDQGLMRCGTLGNHLPLGDLDCFHKPDEAGIHEFVQGLSDGALREISGRL